ncbi:hypothetical protein B0H14DRAFT_3559551 [Mycena olivaceomarginata]|nr:hypothetical protein B0H14DRAFT_3559551 [Mycena olivaceomarginata]
MGRGGEVRLDATRCGNAKRRLRRRGELFNGSRWNLDEIDILDEQIFNRIWSQRTAVLDTYPLDEILEIYSSVHFLRGLIEKLMGNELMQTEDEDLYLQILLSAGPDSIWEAWEAGDYNVLAQYLASETTCLLPTTSSSLVTSCTPLKMYGQIGSFQRMMAEPWRRPVVPPLKHKEHPSRWILDSVNGGEE